MGPKLWISRGLACTCRQRDSGDLVGGGEWRNSPLRIALGGLCISLIIRLVWSSHLLLPQSFLSVLWPCSAMGSKGGMLTTTIYYSAYTGCWALHMHVSLTSHTNTLRKVSLASFYKWKNPRHKELKLLVQNHSVAKPRFEPSSVWRWGLWPLLRVSRVQEGSECLTFVLLPVSAPPPAPPKVASILL